MDKTPRRARLGRLDAIEFPNADPAALTVLCLHGYGADAQDLAPFAAATQAGRPLRWIFPDAPLTLDWGGRAWFPIDVEDFERRQAAGEPRDLSGGEPEGLAAARAALGTLIAALGVPWERLVLMGFSQGGMLAVDAALRAPRPPAGVAILSGTLADRASVRALAPAKKGLRFFQSHGSADPILGFREALALEAELKSAGWVGGLRRFEGGHGVPPEVQAALAAWLKAL
ncbi:MAG: esterase [Elusimicrobia bacterium]|nr:esterase [Elusimicrobiota bacterium]